MYIKRLFYVLQMPKRRKSGRELRQRDRERKRDVRRKAKTDGPTDADVVNPTVLCGTVDEAVTASPSNVLGQVSMGFPLKEEKPLARVRASLREKMHPLAPRLPPPRGSRLFVREQDKAPSPDSPAWVCAPPRAPGPDPVHGSGPAGQAQLEGSREECTSRILKDGGFKTISKQYSETITNSILNEQNVQETIYDENDEITMYDENEMNDISENVYESNDDEDVPNTRHVESCNQNAPKRGNDQVCQYDQVCKSVQGSFHQADMLFENNAGTQCVANCLAALSYNKLKNAKSWTSMDLNRILVTGDELYTFLQRSSSINDRYLLVEELPEHFECFGSLFQFRANEPVASVINAQDGVDYAGFNALPLDAALQISLSDTDGCFVCFGGNSMLIGKTENAFYTFDSHSRNSDGMCSVSGKSTRILLPNIDEVFSHLGRLAHSMGYSAAVQCNFTGVLCKISNIASISGPQDGDDGTCTMFGDSQIFMNTEEDDDLIFVSQDQLQYKFTPMCTELKKHICQNLQLPYISTSNESMGVSENELGSPTIEQQIRGDGNCFFRAISYSLTNSEGFHNVVRNAVCNHLRQNKDLFQPFLRNGIQSVDIHLLSTCMSDNGTWATEVEIFAVAHLLKVDIYTYSAGQWLRFSVEDVEPNVRKETSAIYLNHCMENHYNVVLADSNETIDIPETVSNVEQKEIQNEFTKRKTNRTRMQKTRQFFRNNVKIESANEKRKQSMKRRYQEDSNYRDKKLKSAYDRYREDKDYQANVRLVSRERYHCDIVHQTRKKQSSIRKYAIDDEHREHVKKQSVDKYAENIDHRENVRSRSIQKYAEDEEHMENVKKRSIQKYAEDEEHMENVKKRSIQKYAEDEEHMENVKKRSIQKYAEDEEHMENVKKRSIQKYAQDPQHRKRVQLRSIHKYKSDEIHKMRVIKASVEKYRENNQFREEKLVAAAKKYKTSETLRSKVKADSKRRYESSADQKKEKVKKRRANQKHKMENEDEVVKVFREKAKLGIDYSCCCCDRLLFENQVQRCDRKMYAHNDHVAQIADLCIQEKYSHTCIESCAINCCKAKLWICYTCHRKILRGDIPAESASNKMCLDDIPKELKELNSLEKHLVAMHIPFMKVMALPHGGQKNIHGPVVCVPSDLKKVTSLPAKHGEDMLLRVKLKRKLSYKGYVEYQFVNPKHIFQALKFLKENNEWYKDVTIDTDWKEEINDTQKLLEGEILSVDENLEETACDTCLQPVDIAQEVLDHHFDDIYDIAPGEGKNPIRILQEPGNEAKTFPYLFPSGRFSWNDNRDTRITLSRYFNNRLMNTDDRFAKDSSYIFFSQFMSDLNQVIEKTQISIRKSVTRLGADQKITSDMVQDPQILSNLMKNDEALRFMQPIRGTPAYWSSAQKDLFAMLRQLGIPTWFCSFSAAEHRWNDAVSSILKQQNDNRDPTSLDWSEKNEVLRSNPVTVARMFEHRFHVFQ
ncbi:uncharacterized protein LOC111115941 [Crassostrea virginica]